MSLLDLPYELLVITFKPLDPYTLNSLLLTNRLFNHICTPFLHAHALRPINGLPSLCWAAQQGHLPLVLLLLRLGISPNTKDIRNSPNRGVTALSFATRRGNMSIVRTLLTHGTTALNDLDNTGNTPLTWAVENRNIGVCRILLAAGACPNTYSFEAESPLHWAVRYGDVVLIGLLLKHGASVDVLNCNGMAPLHSAVQDMVPFPALVAGQLLDGGADIDILTGPHRQDHRAERQTPLHLAVWSPGLVDYLVGRGANLNIKDSYGEAPLHKAVHFGSVVSVKALLKNGARTDIKQNEGLTPINTARNLAGTSIVLRFRVMAEPWYQITRLLEEHERVGSVSA